MTEPRNSYERWILKLYPVSMRPLYGPELIQSIRDDLEDARSRPAVVRLVARAAILVDVVLTALRWRLSPGPSPNGPGPRRRGGIPDALLLDVRVALRSLIRQPLYAISVLATLAVGIAANLVMFAVVDSTLLAGLPYGDPERNVVVWETFKQWNTIAPSPANYREWLDNESFEHLSASYSQDFNLASGDEPITAPGAWVTPDFFRTLGVAPALGRDFAPGEGGPNRPSVVVLSYDLWQTQFGADSTLLNRDILIGGAPHTVVGVMPQSFETFYPRKQQLWVPGVTTHPWASDTAQSFRWHWFEVTGRLQPDVSLAAAQAELAAIAERLGEEYPATNQNWGINVRPLREQVLGDSDRVLALMFAAVGLVLVIGTVNIAHLMLARSSARTTEIATRLALGATRARVAQLIVSEAVILSLVGAGAGIALAGLGITALESYGFGGLPLIDEPRIDLLVVVFAFALAMLTALATGLGPALREAKRDIQAHLRERGAAGSGGRRLLGGTLIGVESAILMVLLVGAGLMIGTLTRLLSTDTGFDTAGKIALEMQLSESRFPTMEKQARAYRDMVAGLAAVGGVESVGATTGLPLTGNRTNFGLWFKGVSMRAQSEIPPQAYGVTDGYLEALGVELLAGRFFEPTDMFAPVGRVVISESVAEVFLPGENPIGRELSPVDSLNGPWFTVVGVVSDVRHASLKQNAAPTVYLPMDRMLFDPTRADLLVKTSTKDPLGVAAALLEAARQVDPNQPLARVRTLATVVRDSFADTRFQGLLFIVFAATATILAAVGIYGVIGVVVGQRLHEVGVRMALGATPGRILALMMRGGLTPVTIGAAIGIMLAATSSRLMENMVWGVSPTDPMIYAGAAGALLGVAALACLVPASRAARLDPTRVLRTD